LERSIENARARKEKLDFEKCLLHAHDKHEQDQQKVLKVEKELELERQVLPGMVSLAQITKSGSLF
jgi:hypothetical protein